MQECRSDAVVSGLLRDAAGCYLFVACNGLCAVSITNVSHTHECCLTCCEIYGVGSGRAGGDGVMIKLSNPGTGVWKELTLPVNVIRLCVCGTDR